jgi:hypothetical protein
MSADYLQADIDFALVHNHRIAGESPGISTIDGVPARVQALLIRAHPLAILASRLTNADGTYEFVGLDPSATYIVIGRDRDAVHNAAVADHIVPAPLPS